jgi:hypothetical protein
MTQSKNKEDSTFTINLDNTYGTTTTYSTNDTITISTIGSDSIYTGYTGDSGMNSNYNISIGNISGIDPSTLSTDNSIILVLWEDKLPNPSRVKKMCEHYPALEKAYENFKSIYKMVEQDYKGNHEDEDDQLLF